MAGIFLSYRRTNGAEACRVREWLVRRLGADAVFMDVENIPFAVSFPDYIKKEIANSKVMLALIGDDWAARINQPNDQVLPEIEQALSNQIPVLPVLIGNTAMPNPDKLPSSIANIARQNAERVGILNDFDAHMRLLLPKIEAILGALATDSIVTSNPEVIRQACDGISRFLFETYRSDSAFRPEWLVVGTSELAVMNFGSTFRATLFLHRVTRLAELLELHFIMSVWAPRASDEQLLGGWIMRQLEQTPVIPRMYFGSEQEADLQLKIRRSDEDPRVIWKMITDQPLRLSLAYVATITPAVMA